MTKKMEVIIYCDGACKGNPGPGGWGAVLECKGATKEIFGGEKNTTNNQMELTAAINAFKALIKPCEVTLYTDSNYVIKGILEWMPGWKKKGWKTASGTPVKNVELWKELDLLVQQHSVSWHWVKGHSGNPGNERADQLANKGINSL